MTATVVSPVDPGLLAELAGHRYASLFTSPPWIEALERTYGLVFSAVVQGQNGTSGGAILFSHVSDFRGERIVCLPFSDYCDPLVDDPATWHDLAAPLFARALPLGMRCLHNDLPAADPRLQVTGEAIWHAVDLTRSEEELWAGLGGSARQNVRRAERSGVVVRAGKSLADVRRFHDMHCRVRKSKYRLLAQPAAFFDHLFEVFAPTDAITVLLAELDGEPIAGIVFIAWQGTLYYKFNASIDLRTRPNDLLIWQGILMGQQLGLDKLDFGLSDLDQPGLIRYKSKYATESRAIVQLRWQPGTHANPVGEQATRTLGRMTELLTEPSVPDTITRAAGDELYRFFC